MTDDNNEGSEQLPKKLFHYTGMAAFGSIYKSKKLHATHYKDLKDKSELKLFRRKVYEFMRPIFREFLVMKMQSDEQYAPFVNIKGGIDAVITHEAKERIVCMHQATFGKKALLGGNAFVSCFCAHDPDSYAAKHGLLSQWRGYSADGGVAIGICQ